jgi:putative OPT family oligopeptide transporter
VPASANVAELTPRAVLLGVVFGIIFGASSVYLALKVGLTVSASIPIAVVSIVILKTLGRGTILESNIVQTVGSAGESIAAGSVFVLPAIILLGYDLEFGRVAVIAMTAGVLGVLLMIPLRRALIVKEHGNLKYPEGVACAEVLIAGETKGAQAALIFQGGLVGFVYKVLNSGLKLWQDTPEKLLTFFKGGSIAAEVSPELLGVGYIIGYRTSAVMMAGGVMSYLVLIPAIKIFGDGLPGAAAQKWTPVAAETSKCSPAGTGFRAATLTYGGRCPAIAHRVHLRQSSGVAAGRRRAARRTAARPSEPLHQAQHRSAVSDMTRLRGRSAAWR